MRLPRMRFTLRSMMVWVVVLAVGSWAYVRYQRWSYYDVGWWEAEREIWRGELTVFRSEHCDCEHCSSDEGHGVDRVTGLPVKWFWGCQIEAGEQERVHGHNLRVAQYIRWHGLPKNSFKRWEKELFDLANYFDTQSRIETPKRLCAGGTVLVAPDGKTRVEPLSRRGDDGSVSEYALDLVISAGDDVVGKPCVRSEKGDSELVWGPPGSRFVVVRTLEAHEESFKAYSLWNGGCLRSETWVREKDGIRRTRSDSLPPLPIEINDGHEGEDAQSIAVFE